MKNAVAALCAVALLLFLPSAGMAQGKIRIAVWDFDNNAPTHWWFSDRLGTAARNQIDTALGGNATLSDTFSVVEREKLAMVLKEQGLAGSGAVDPQTAAKVGRILGVKYIVTGGIDAFSIDRTGGAVGRLGVGGHLVQAQAAINLRFIDTTTAERVVSLSGEGEVRKGGGFFRGTSLSRDAEWGLASETIEKASKAVVEQLVAGGYLARITAGAGTGAAVRLEGKVAKVDGNRAWITIGSSSGVKAGDKFQVLSVGEDVIDPDTGQKLGASEEKEIGSGAITEVQERFSVITFTGSASVRDLVRRQP